MSDRPIIGVLTPLAGGMYYGGLLTGIADAVAAVGGRAMAIQTLRAGHLNDDYQARLAFDQSVGWDHLDGFIVIVNGAPPEFLARVHEAGKPIVSISNESTGLDCPVVQPDNRTGIREAVRHLVEHGHTRIGFTGFLGQGDIQERYDAYRDALVGCGITPDESLFVPIEDNDERGGRAAASAMLAAGLPSTAMVAGTDLNAIGMMSGLLAAGHSLPQDQAIVGFDDAEVAAHVSPSLSSVKQDFSEVGRLAATLLLAAMRGESVPAGRREVTTSFVIRESCGCSGWRATASTDRKAAVINEVGLVAPVDNQLVGDAFDDTAATQLFTQTMLTALATVHPAVATPVVLRAAEQLSLLMRAATEGSSQPPIGVVRQALSEVERLAPTPEVGAAIVDGLRTFAQSYRVSGADADALRRLDDAVISGVWALAQGQGTRSYEQQTYLLAMLASQYDVGMKLLRGLDRDASQLTWLDATKATSGVLGLWSDPVRAAMTVAGSYRRDGTFLVETGGVVPLEAFPPAELFTEVPDKGAMLFAVPVMSATSDWGWFITLSPIESVALTGWEAQNQWAALLTIALDEADAARKLKSLEREWHAILENTPDALARYDTQLRYEYLNRAAARSLDMEPVDIVGRTDAELGRDPAITAIWETGLRQVLASGAPAQVEFSEGTDVDLRWFQARLVPQLDSEGMIVGVLASSRDLTAVKKAELALAHQAVHDSLTGLANRVLLVDRLSHSLTRMEREAGRIAVLFIDLDRFKVINDSLGHDTGDRLLVEVAERLRAASRRVDTVARLGGDEFVILCDKLSSDEDVRIIGDRVVRSLGQPFLDKGIELAVSASIGVVVASDPFTDAATLLRNADAAMYQAKERGGNRFLLFDPDLESRATTRHTLETDLRHAIVRNELRLEYQPLFALDGGRINGVEALLRWQHPTRGLLMPADFMSVAEQRGLIVGIGAWVLDEACRQLAQWDSDPELAGVTMAVNVSGRQLAVPDIAIAIEETLARHLVDPGRITLEITETTLIEEGVHLRETLDAIVALGVHLALDDFGTGYSALAHLRDFPVDILKIDRSFVDQLGAGGRARQIVGALTAMAHFLDMTVVGEGIETLQQWSQLRDLHCDDGQGFLVSKAVPPEQLVALMRKINGVSTTEAPMQPGSSHDQRVTPSSLPQRENQ